MTKFMNENTHEQAEHSDHTNPQRLVEMRTLIGVVKKQADETRMHTRFYSEQMELYAFHGTSSGKEKEH